MKGSCSTCKYWVRVDGRGRCHKNAPAPCYRACDTRMVQWPHTEPEQVCGQYEKNNDDK